MEKYIKLTFKGHAPVTLTFDLVTLKLIGTFLEVRSIIHPGLVKIDE